MSFCHHYRVFETSSSYPGPGPRLHAAEWRLAASVRLRKKWEIDSAFVRTEEGSVDKNSERMTVDVTDAAGHTTQEERAVFYSVNAYNKLVALMLHPYMAVKNDAKREEFCIALWGELLTACGHIGRRTLTAVIAEALDEARPPREREGAVNRCWMDDARRRRMDGAKLSLSRRRKADAPIWRLPDSAPILLFLYEQSSKEAEMLQDALLNRQPLSALSECAPARARFRCGCAIGTEEVGRGAGAGLCGAAPRVLVP